MTAIQDVALSGLTAQQAAERLAADGPNELPTSRKRNLLRWQSSARLGSIMPRAASPGPNWLPSGLRSGS
jgi:Cation transporter/ATPase, N-terminus